MTDEDISNAAWGARPRLLIADDDAVLRSVPSAQLVGDAEIAKTLADALAARVTPGAA